jgi:hypothetical protein
MLSVRVEIQTFVMVVSVISQKLQHDVARLLAVVTHHAYLECSCETGLFKVNGTAEG